MEKRKSLFHNFLFNMIKTLNSILFPILTFTYSSRVLGAAGVGKVNFAKSIISYFTMLAMLGMNYYGTREVARLRNDREKLSRFCMEMLTINGCTTILAYVLLAVTMLFSPRLSDYRTLLLINSVAIVLQGMGMEWLYQGMEEYRYIAIRSALFQIGALASLFVFVRNENDVIPYAVVSLTASSGSYILNFFNARKFFDLHIPAYFNLKKHLKPLFWLFSMAVSIELYTVLDTTMLGLLKGDVAVGLYTAAIKVERIVNAVIASVGVVLIPRLSFYIGQREYERINSIIDKAFNYIFMLSIPAAVGIFVLSDDIILLVSGNQFARAGLTMQIMSPIIIFIPFSTLTNQQIFIPMRKEKLILISTSVGAIVNLTLNALLIPRYAENGAAVATTIAEAAVALVCFVNGNIQFNVRKFFARYYQYWIAIILIPIICLVIKNVPVPPIIQIIMAIVLSCSEYFMCLFLMKNSYLSGACRQIHQNLIKRKN